ncbi:MAG: 6-carboxytetrahydropterin synthase [Candidatus Marinimicrobia bacterium]|nr:6-carboxytetrahydropterin synthase [Candidatus Neomarinimicrobiota bacterium]MDD5582865.1 6-carboxytetrahydropterin synthase [Candidatus Neomarinimicrobiota bacterium]
MVNKLPIIELYTRTFLSAAYRYDDANLTEEENQQKYGKYHQVHGHTFEVILGLRGPVDPKSGMMINFFDVEKIIKEKILSPLDTTQLDKDIPWFKHHLPTIENISLFFMSTLKDAFPPPVKLISVEVNKTPYLGAKINNDKCTT